MFCAGCGNPLSGEYPKFCNHCGTAVLSPAVSTSNACLSSPRARLTNIPLGLFICLGGLFGFLAGCVTRPAAMLVGQLPLFVVLSRGVTLQGFDQLLVPFAEESFNHIIMVTLSCAAFGAAVEFLLRKVTLR